MHYFLGIEVGYLPEGFLLIQKKFSSEVLAESGLDLSKKVVTPLPVNLKLQATSGDLPTNPESYRSLVGKLNFLNCTRPNLAFIVQTLSQFMHCPRTSHWEALHIPSDISLTLLAKASFLEQQTLLHFSIFQILIGLHAQIPGGQLLVTFSYWVIHQFLGNPRNKLLSANPLQKLNIYRVMASAASKVAWTVRLLEESGVINLKPISLHCDNQSALHIAKNPCVP